MKMGGQLFLVLGLVSLVVSQGVQTGDPEAELNSEDAEAMDMLMDSIMEDLIGRYDAIKTDNFWHPNTFGLGNAHREELSVSGIREKQVPGNILKWSKVQMGLKQQLFALTPNSIEIYDSSLQKVASKDLPFSLKSMETYTKWDETSFTPYAVSIVATDAPSILVFRSTKDEPLQEFGSLPLQSNIRTVKIVKIDKEEKVVLVPETSSEPISLYNIDTTKEDEAQVWFLQRLSEPGFNSVEVQQPDTVDSVLLVAKDTSLNIYNYDPNQGQFVTEHSLPLKHSCSNLVPFTLQYQHYVGCMSKDEVSDDVQFLSFNSNVNEYEESSLSLIQAAELVPMEIGDAGSSSVFLTRQRVDNAGLGIMAFDGQNEFKSSGVSCNSADCLKISTLSDGACFQMENLNALALPTSKDQDSATVLTFETQLTPVSSPVFEQSTSLYKDFKDLAVEMSRWRQTVDHAEEILSKKINTEGDNVITGKWTVRNIETEDVVVDGLSARDTTTPTETMFNTIKFGDIEWSEGDFATDAAEIDELIALTNNKLRGMMVEMDDALLKNSSEVQIVQAPVTINGKVAALNMQVNQLNLQTIGGTNATEWLQTLANKQDRNVRVEGVLTFVEPLKASQLLVTNLNDVLVADIALLNANNKFDCPTEFDALEATTITTELVNGQNLQEVVVMATDVNGYHFVDGIVAFETAETADEMPFDDILLRSTPQTVSSTVIFDSVQIKSPMSVTNVNGENFNAFISKVITKDHQGRIFGNKSFTGNVNMDSFKITNSWEGFSFPQDFFMTSVDSMVLQGKTSFQKVVSNTATSSSINGIDTNDLVSLTKAEVLNDAVWVFTQDTRISKNIQVATFVDGIPMESLLHTGMINTKATQFEPNANVVFTSPVHVQDLNVKSTINGQSYSEMFGDLIVFDCDPCTVPGTTVIKDSVSFGDIQLADNLINGVSVENFLTKDTPQVIPHEVIMENSVFFEQITVHGLYDNVSPNEIADKAMRVSKISGQDISKIPFGVHFESIKCNDAFSVQGPINGLSVYGTLVAVTEGRELNFNSPIVVTSPEFLSIEAKDILMPEGKTIQNLDLLAWDQSRIKMSQPTSLSKPLSVHHLTIQGDLQTPMINGISVEDLRNNVFRRNGLNQNFEGPIHLNSLEVLNGKLHFHKNLDGFSLNDLRDHGFPLQAIQPIEIKNSWTFESILIQNGIQVDDQLCGVSLKSLVADTVKRGDSVADILGKKHFTQPVTVTTGITSPHINGKDLDKVFLLHHPQIIESTPTFSSDLRKEVLDAESINGVDMDWLRNAYSFENGRHILNTNAVITGPVKAETLFVRGNLRDTTFDEFLQDAVILSDPVEFDKEVEFVKPVVIRKGASAGTYNGLDMEQLGQDVVMLNEDIIFNQPVSFQGPIKATEVLVDGDVNAAKLANGVDLKDLQENSIKLNDRNGVARIRGNVRFDDLRVAQPVQTKSLNNRPVDEYITLNSDQDLGSLNIVTMSLQDANVKVMEGGTVAGHNISEAFHDTIMTNTNDLQTISGNVNFNGPVHIENDMSCFGPSFQHDVVTTQEPLNFEHVTFTSPIVVENDIELARGIADNPLESFFQGAFRTDGEQQVISDKWEFLGPVTFVEDISGPGVENNLNIESLVQEKEDEMKRAAEKVATEKETFARKCSAVKLFWEKVSNNPVKLDSFEIQQIISLPNESSDILTVQNGDGVSLLVQTTSCTVDIYKWHNDLEVFNRDLQSQVLSFGTVTDWQSAALQDGSSVIVFSKTPSDCSADQGLFSVTVSPSGELSTPTQIHSNPVKSFKIVSPDNENIKVLSLVSGNDAQVEVMTLAENQFVLEQTIQMGSSIKRVDAIPTKRGFTLMCHNDRKLMMYEMGSEWTQQVGANTAFLASNTGTMKIFQNFDTVYGLVAESGVSSPSLIQPACNLQVVRFNEGAIEAVQKLQVPEIVSSSVWSFSKKTFATFLSRSHGMSVYKFKGLNGFEPVGQPYKVFGATKVKSFFVKRLGNEMATPFVLALSPNSVQVFRGNVFGDAISTDFQCSEQTDELNAN